MKPAIQGLIAAAFVMLAPGAALAQENATVTGRVTNAAGAPENAVAVNIEQYRVGARTGPDGSYRLVIPGSRIRAGQQVKLIARPAGVEPLVRTFPLMPGARRVEGFRAPKPIKRDPKPR